jgi:CheY-like chemotaxis protein
MADARPDRPEAVVLLVEDDEDNRELMTEVLESDGYRVVLAVNGAEALRVLGAQRVDVVVTDIGMPGVGGLDVARAAAAAQPRIPVVVVTGYSERDDVASARDGIDRVLVKPIDPDMLTEAVTAALGRNPGR